MKISVCNSVSSRACDSVRGKLKYFESRTYRCKRMQLASSTTGIEVNRRELFGYTAMISTVLSSQGLAIAAKGPKGFNPVEDTNDGYKFLYPFGWQEVSVNGVDVVYKDIVEPFETVSVSLLPTDKTSIGEYGSVQEVAETLARNVLTAPGSEVNVLTTSERDDEYGHKYYQFEFTAKSNFAKHQLAVVTVAYGKFYTLTVGCTEKRWGRIKEKLETTAKSFSLIF
ncbi:hypothetical protein CEUSTIGMA_g9747.t1 [Chlamydomonas eustigma]|uniref:PsbP C-terminal domain-containing protein n=1 Tax=Chlamydomonas eustigma TaxID=1157962 RepID=A0A250XGW6_9CHLO|nr:hypothetical protein CEUSTIGMA_g9747.t1 [Chlamydomonas eustigma]|eukprot:GAX82318.1 hypothetical protein CEUSTIGMA_g9747.t1 [Chlamydomonas eustigma]